MTAGQLRWLRMHSHKSSFDALNTHHHVVGGAGGAYTQIITKARCGALLVALLVTTDFFLLCSSSGTLCSPCTRQCAWAAALREGHGTKA